MPHGITGSFDWKGRLAFKCDGDNHGVCQTCAIKLLEKLEKILNEAVLVK